MPYPYYQAFQPYIQQSYQQPQQTNNNGIITVRNKEEAFNYPIAPGNSLTFKNETEPYIYTKTLGFSQLDQPIFEVFRLEKEENVEAPKTAFEEPVVQFLTIDEANALKSEIEALKHEINFLKEYIEDDKKEVIADA